MVGGERMKSGSITPSEMVHMHEILSLKNTCAVKASALQSLVSDQRLGKILEQDIATARQQLQDIKNVLTQTNAVS
jgi:similar to spore coat protein